MNCPNCHSPLKETTINTQSDQEAIVHECFTCGGHWFPHWLANDISLSTAQSIDSIIPKNPPPPSDQPRCPECQLRLSLISHDSIPKGVHVWSCPNGHGNFFTKGELLQFKKAQQAKITYHQLWGIPIKSVFAVLLPIFILLAVTAGIPLTMNQLQTSQETRTKATQFLSQPPNIIPIPPSSASISFQTPSTQTSTLTLYKNSQKIKDYPVSTTPKNFHTLTLKDLDYQSSYTFTITLSSDQSKNTTEKYSINLE